MAKDILVIDDDPIQHEFLSGIINEHLPYEVDCVSSGQEALDYIKNDHNNNTKIILLDMMMPGLSGTDVIKNIKLSRSDISIIVVTAHSDISMAIKTLRMGAEDFILKHESPERIITSIKNITDKQHLTDEVQRLQRSASGHTTFNDIIGTTSTQMQKVMTVAKKASTSDIAVLIKGESGVGKELFAQAIHGSGPRMGKPFVSVNCSTIPNELIASTLFGHEKGDFDGALYKSVGKIKEANGGTLFLDEIEALPLEIQAKLLSFIQNSDSKSESIDIRIISATNQNLKRQIRLGNFREDLFHMLSVFPITIPPLRNRGEDIDFLIDYCFSKITVKERSSLRDITDDARTLLKRYSWPGNVRQLENIIFRAIVLCEGEYVEKKDFLYLENTMKQPDIPVENTEHRTLSLLENSDSHFKNLSQIEEEVIRAALEKYKWKISEVARRLGIGRSTLYRKMSEIGIDHNKISGERSRNNIIKADF